MKELHDLEELNEVLGGLEKCGGGTDPTTTVHPNGSAGDGCE